MVSGASGLPKVLRVAVFSIFSDHIFHPCQYHLSTSQSQAHFPSGTIKGCLILLRTAISTFYSELGVPGMNQIAEMVMGTIEKTTLMTVTSTIVKGSAALRAVALSVLQEALGQGAGGDASGSKHSGKLAGGGGGVESEQGSSGESGGYEILRRVIAGCAAILKSGKSDDGRISFLLFGRSGIWDLNVCSFRESSELCMHFVR